MFNKKYKHEKKVMNHTLKTMDLHGCFHCFVRKIKNSFFFLEKGENICVTSTVWIIILSVKIYFIKIIFFNNSLVSSERKDFILMFLYKTSITLFVVN